MAGVFFHLLVGPALAQRPLAGIAILRNNSPRTVIMTSLLEERLVNITEASGIVKPVNPALLRQELNKFGCIEEQCLFGFAQDAEIKLLIRGELDDTNDYVVLKLIAYGTDIPYQNKVVYAYTVRIPMSGQYSTDEYGNIAEEHAGIFLSNLFRRYQIPVYVVADAGNQVTMSRPISGSYTVYRLDAGKGKKSIRAIKTMGTANIASGKIVTSDFPLLRGDFILAGFRETADSMDVFYYERKREISLQKPAVTDTLLKILLTGPASATMPIVAPIFGYYWHSDWQGLALWAFNIGPYLYLEINGLTNYFVNYYKKKKTVPQDVQTQFYFGLYMLSAGGASLVADSLAHSLLRKAANYQGTQRFLGNSFSAGYLALVSSGAGLFYRGYRLWGYIYFHVDNLLLFFTIREFCPDKKYMVLSRSFSGERINKIRAYSLLSALGAVKVAEFFHSVFIRDNIRNGDIIEEDFTVEPFVYAGEKADFNLGMRLSYRF
jgi:hypothetical protein